MLLLVKGLWYYENRYQIRGIFEVELPDLKYTTVNKKNNKIVVSFRDAHSSVKKHKFTLHSDSNQEFYRLENKKMEIFLHKEFDVHQRLFVEKTFYSGKVNYKELKNYFTWAGRSSTLTKISKNITSGTGGPTFLVLSIDRVLSKKEFNKLMYGY